MHCYGPSPFVPSGAVTDWANDLVTRIVSDAESRGIHALYLLTLTAELYFPRFGFERVERDAVPAEIRETVEFKSACPSTATVMMRLLD